jgi:DNA polymerase-4
VLTSTLNFPYSYLNNKLKIHIDIDCFFVSATRILYPKLENKPVAIGGRSDSKIFIKDTKKQILNLTNSGSFVPRSNKDNKNSNDDINVFKDENGKIRGILTTSSYEARAFGVKTAMNISHALMLCPKLIIKAPDMAYYKNLSNELHEFLQKRIPLVEKASIDEFYADLSGWVEDVDVEKFICNLKQEIKETLKLPVSIGASKTRYIAKLATSSAKPYGCKIVLQKDLDSFIHNIPVEDFAGVGKSMKLRLSSAQIHTLGQLKNRGGTLESWSPYAKELHKRVSGIADAPIITTRKRKSIGISRTFSKIFDRDECKRRVSILSRHLNFAILKLNVIPTVFHLTLSYEMGQSSHKNITICEVFTEKKFNDLVLKLFEKADIQKRLQIIRISINCSSFTRDSKKALSLIGFNEEKNMKKLTDETQKMREKYGIDILKWGSELR